jgi:uncharacterized protein
MAELQRLWKLAQVDRALVDVRARAAALDPGKKLMAELQALEKVEQEVGGKARALLAEQRDLELQQLGFQEKLKRIDKELYGGKVVNPREVEHLEKETAALKRQRDAHDERLLELMEELPPAQEAAAGVESKIAEKKKQLAERRKQALVEKANLEAEYKRLNEARPAVAEAVRNPSLMARYDAIRQRHGGIGMAQVTKKHSCGECGTNLPTKTVESAKEDRVVMCESCHRILYYTEGIV